MFAKRLLLAGVAAFAVSSAATAADLIVDIEDEPGIIVEDDVGNWDGPYIGVFAGWGWGFADHTNGDVGPCVGMGNPDGCDVDMSGWLLGLVAGANFTVTDGIIFGIAGDIAWTDITGTDDFPVIGESTNSVNWEGSIRGVLGFDGGMFMPYLTAGLAVANADHFAEIALGDIPTVNATHFGGTIGAGVQVAVAENVALDFQYRASFYNEQEYDHDTGFPPPVFALTTHRFTAGINLSF
jgi:outer membrane immunogenic protein